MSLPSSACELAARTTDFQHRTTGVFLKQARVKTVLLAVANKRRIHAVVERSEIGVEFCH
ncbi:MAG: hypothetical protein ACKVUS_10315 [Saprospiraceae bacterium]